MREIIVELTTAFLGSLGFALLFNTRGKHLWPASLGGLLSWGVYLMMGLVTQSDPLRYLVAAAALTVYAELLARRLRTPATVFLVAGTIPLIPGGSLYRTMECALRGDHAGFSELGINTLLLAGAIAGGILLMMPLFHVNRNNMREP